MLNSTLQLKVKQRLNKLDSQDYENLECWQIIEAFNKAQIEWVRRQIMGRNMSQEGAEQTVRKVDDLQNLLTPVPLTSISAGAYYETEPLPSNYLEFHKIDIEATKDNCCTEPKKMIVYLVEEANSSILQRDELRQPNFEWGETFCTIVNNRIRVYTNSDFTVSSITLLYYRKPINIQIIGCGDPYTGLISATDISCEFRDDITEILIDSAASIMAGDIESFSQQSRTSQSSETNT
jgi:hypothetical protein